MQTVGNVTGLYRRWGLLSIGTPGAYLAAAEFESQRSQAAPGLAAGRRHCFDTLLWTARSFPGSGYGQPEVLWF